MSSLLAIDSGHPECTVAGAEGGRLVNVGVASLERVPSWMLFEGYDRAVVEIPTLRGNATPNPEDLILVAVAGARLAQRFVLSLADVTEYRPSQWKSNTPKPAHHRRMWRSLTAAERKLLGGDATLAAINAACMRGAKSRWAKPGATYYRARELPTVNGQKITHDVLDASALALYALGRIGRG